jgi:putative ABC transport system permease protein
MQNLMQDLHYTLRLFRRYPIISGVVILAIAVGIGANTAIFTVINGVLLQPLPFDKQDRLVVIYSVSVPNFLDWKAQNKVMDGMTAYVSNGVNLTGGSEPQRIQAVRVADGYFQTVGVPVLQGRGFTEDDHRPGAAPVVILSYALWQQIFAGNVNVLGSSIQLGGKPHMVVGIMPGGVQFPTTAQALLPYQFEDKDHYNRTSNFLTVVGRLKKGMALRQAQAEFDSLNQRIEQQYHSNIGRKVTLYSVHERLVSNIRPLLLLLQVAVAFILLIACANIANLLIAWAGIRHQELAVRMAHGASQPRIVRQLFTECAVMSFTGCALGLLLATQATRAFVALIPANAIPKAASLAMDVNVFLFALGIAAITSIGFGIAPVLQLFKTNVSDTLKEGGRSLGGTATGSKFRRAFAVSELAFALLLLIASGLTLKSFRELRRVDPGFQADQLLTFQLNLPPLQLNDVPKRFQMITDELHKVGEIPGVRSASISVNVPLEGKNISGDFHIAGRSMPGDQKWPEVDEQVVGPSYFQTMKIPLIRGRDFTESDNESAPKVTLISKMLAGKYFPGQDPVGTRVAFEGLDGQPVWMEIIGVVGNVKSGGLDRDPSITAYVPLRQVPPDIVALFLPTTPVTIIVRSSQDPAGVTQLVRSAVYSVDHDQPISEVKTMNSVVLSSIAEPRLESFLLGTFAGVALFLAIIGVYAVMNSLVQQREREIGVRMAFGATRGGILKLIISDAAKMVSAGLVLGFLLSFILLKVLSSWLYGAKTHDVAVFVLAPVLLFVTAMLACFIPALRASNESPMAALRFE